VRQVLETEPGAPGGGEIGLPAAGGLYLGLGILELGAGGAAGRCESVFRDRLLEIVIRDAHCADGVSRQSPLDRLANTCRHFSSYAGSTLQLPLKMAQIDCEPISNLKGVALGRLSHFVKKTAKDFIDRSEWRVLCKMPRYILHDLCFWSCVHHLRVSVRPVASMMQRIPRRTQIRTGPGVVSVLAEPIANSDFVVPDWLE